MRQDIKEAAAVLCAALYKVLLTRSRRDETPVLLSFDLFTARAVALWVAENKSEDTQ